MILVISSTQSEWKMFRLLSRAICRRSVYNEKKIWILMSLDRPISALQTDWSIGRSPWSQSSNFFTFKRLFFLAFKIAFDTIFRLHSDGVRLHSTSSVPGHSVPNAEAFVPRTTIVRSARQISCWPMGHTQIFHAKSGESNLPNGSAPDDRPISTFAALCAPPWERPLVAES